MPDEDWTIHDTDEAVARAEAERELIKRGHEGLVGHDAHAPEQPGILTPGTPCGLKWTPVASFSAEATAKFLSSGDTADLGKAVIHNPATAALFEEQQTMLRDAVYDGVVPALARALDKHSAQTAHRLRTLSQQSHAGDAQSRHLLAVMLGELLTWGLRP